MTPWVIIIPLGQESDAAGPTTLRVVGYGGISFHRRTGFTAAAAVCSFAAEQLSLCDNCRQGGRKPVLELPEREFTPYCSGPWGHYNTCEFSRLWNMES
jgi:hypothetical protein